MSKKIRLNGWWRLYIVISILWAALILVDSFDIDDIFYSKGKLTATVEFSNPNGSDKKTVKIIFSDSFSDSNAEYLIESKYGPELKKLKFEQIPNVYEKPYLEYIARKQKKIISIVVSIVMPLTVLLGIALTFVWVKRGFQQHKPT